MARRVQDLTLDQSLNLEKLRRTFQSADLM